MLENELFGYLSIQVAGGTVFSTPMLNVLITDSGDVFACALTIQSLLDIAAG